MGNFVCSCWSDHKVYANRLLLSIFHHHCIIISEKIANDFQNEELQSAWKNVQISILERRAARNRQLEETSAKLQGKAKQTEAWVAENEKLDVSIEELRNKFSDAKVALDYDAKNLEDYVKAHQPWKKEMPCLGQRAHWIDCQKKYALDSVSIYCYDYIIAS